MPSKHTRDIVVHWWRNNKRVAERRFVRLETAIRRMSQLAYVEGQPGDVIEYTHRTTGAWIGGTKVRVGSFTTNWATD